MGARDMGTERRSRRALAAVVALLLVVTVAAAVLAARAVRTDQERRFAAQADRLDAALAERMTAYVQVLRGGLGLFVASDRVTREDWLTYVETLRLTDRYPGFKSLSYAPAVRARDLDAFVARTRAELTRSGRDGSAYSLRAPSGSSGRPAVHAPILYVAPDRADNRAVLGVDMMLEPMRREVMERAAREGTAVASPRLRLSGSADQEAGFIVYVPIERDGRLLGWLTAAFLAREFTRGLEVARATDLGFEIRDGAGSDAALLYSTADVADDGSPQELDRVADADLVATSEVAVPGGTWTVRYVAPDGFVPSWARLVPWLVLLVGLLLTTVVVAVVRSGERWRRLAVALDRQSRDAEDARAAAEQATLAKSTFLATMSHEIRTPLNAVLAANSVLLESPLDPTQTSYAGIVRDSGAHLLHVVNEILDLSKAEAGRVVLEDEALDLDQCVATVLDLLGAEADRRGVTLTADQRAPTRVVGDVARLRQVLLNLVSNAVKFTPAGGRVVLRSFPVPPADDALVGFEVADTGVGIAPERLAELFDPYVQAAASTTRTHGGTGLGLSIARRLVEAMGGTITVDSTVGEGTTFRFTVRMPPAPVEAPTTLETETLETETPGTEPGAVARRLRVLVAEDDLVSQELLGVMLDLLGHDADLVDDGLAAVRLAAESAGTAAAYDVVLLDRHMPGLDGLEAARRIRAVLPGVWVVAVSGSTGADGFGALADDEVSKPYVLDDLAAALARATVTPPEDSTLLR